MFQILYKESSKTESDSKTASKEELVNGLDDDSDIIISDDEDILSDMNEGIPGFHLNFHLLLNSKWRHSHWSVVSLLLDI